MKRNASTQSGYSLAVVDAALSQVTAPLPALDRPWLIGISALQGSGKSTLSAQCVELARTHGHLAMAMSLDDFYLGRRDRQRLARTQHPLFATRGAPGTHDVALLESTLDALATASAASPARVPRFDKGRDTRMSPSRWRVVRQAPQLIFLEGWCLGIPAQTHGDLLAPINALEREHDAAGTWRSACNDALASDYARLWRRLNRLVVLQAPNFEVISRWRNEQEDCLRARGAPHAMTKQAIEFFVLHYERLSRHALKHLPARAHLLFELDDQRNVTRISVREPAAASCARSSRY
jgi:D-glycerate 3-kinase